MATAVPGEPETRNSYATEARKASRVGLGFHGPPTTGYVGPLGVHAPTAGFTVGFVLIIFALLGLASAFDLSSVVGIVVLVLGFALVALTTTPLGRLTFKALGVEVEVNRHQEQRQSPGP
jgi:hypothetical protein